MTQEELPKALRAEKLKAGAHLSEWNVCLAAVRGKRSGEQLQSSRGSQLQQAAEADGQQNMTDTCKLHSLSLQWLCLPSVVEV